MEKIWRIVRSFFIFRRAVHVGINWTRPRPSLPDGGGTCRDHPGAPRVRPLPVRGTCRDQLDAHRARPFRCVAHVGISWTRPASVPSGAGAHVGISWTRPRPSSSRQRGHVQGVRCVRHGTGGKVLPGRGTR